MKKAESIYAEPRTVSDISDCFIYHTMLLPTYGLVNGQWDLRDSVDAYLGGVKMAGKRVLEVGTANGFLCSEMEKRGAEVVAYDLSENDQWDIVPFGGRLPTDLIGAHKQHIRQLNNAWWLVHRLLSLQVRMVYGSAYSIPEEIGSVNISTFGCILLHLRDPFLALQKAAALTTEVMIVTDIFPKHTGVMPELTFLPNPDTKEPRDTWWYLSPNLIARYLQVLGFPSTEISRHEQKCEVSGRMEALYTVVGRKE